MQLNYCNRMLPSPVESRADHDDSEIRQTARRSQPIQINQPILNNGKSLRRSSAQEITLEESRILSNHQF
jgi:hypothetical protein